MRLRKSAIDSFYKFESADTMSYLYDVLDTLNLVNFLSLVIFLILVFINIKNMIDDSSKDISIYRKIGFNKGNILFYYLLSMFVANVVSFLFSIIFFVIVAIVINKFFKITLFFTINTKILMLLGIFLVVTILIVTVRSIRYCNKGEYI